MRLFVTATGTDVGKTVAAAGLLRALKEAGRRPGYFKLAASGAEEMDGEPYAGDGAFCMDAIEPREDWWPHRSEHVPFVYGPAVSPHLAGRWAGNEPTLAAADGALASLEHRCDVIVAEGAGGVAVPLSARLWTTDLMVHLNGRVVLVTGSYVGAISHCLTAWEWLVARKLTPVALVINGWDDSAVARDNLDVIQATTGVSLVATVPWLDDPHQAWRHFAADFLSGVIA